MKLLAIRRLLRIQRVVIRYKLDDLLFNLPLPFWARMLRYALPWRWLPRRALQLSRGARLRLALEELGPIFIKFGQLLSTRRDLLRMFMAGGVSLAAGGTILGRASAALASTPVRGG